jgi:dihydroorotate dehydrogenase/Pyruvate/2-oxoacid:ferredoxin oxidoreductase delta subunit
MTRAEVNLSVDFLGMKLRNPLVITEGPLTKDAQTIRWALEHEVGMVFTKGIRPEPMISPTPYVVKAGRSLMNADWSDIGFPAWIEEIRTLDKGTPFVASIAKNYVTPEEAVDMAVQLQAAGAPIISMCDYVPEQLVETIRVGRPRIKVPLMCKLPPFLPNLEEILKQLVDYGADAIAAMDSIGPCLEVDINTGLPTLGSQDGTGYLSGTAIRPVTVKYIYEISRFVDIPVVGVGGVSSARDVIEMVMVGATCVGMVAAPLLRGLGIFDRLAADLRELLAKLGSADINALRGLTHRRLREFEMSYEQRSEIDYDLCNYCKLCSKVCFVRAITDTGEKVVSDRSRCLSCGLCASVCPVGAIELTAD